MVTDPLYAPYYDEKFRAFISGLSTTDTLPRFGIRLPVLEKISREIDWRELEIKWHEDVILTGLAIGNSSLTPIEKVEELKKLLPLQGSILRFLHIPSFLKPSLSQETGNCMAHGEQERV